MEVLRQHFKAEVSSEGEKGALRLQVIMKGCKNEMTALVAYTNKDKNTAPKKLENYSEHDKQNEYTDRTSEPTTDDDFLSVTTSENILDLIATRGFWNTMLSLFYSYGKIA
ncbi:hypothetical protein E2C01_085976 [Portunus trituberculatus]|uniref:Uncharacterized protein n=1 Tax=Portunus trituberculatus TaxID=210409 RepID=A0A5B7JDD2_PORTR|nr:hypothetical protein [Portunus trituberculatus]